MNTVAAVICEDRHLSRRSLASLLKISPTSINGILKNELKIKRVSLVWAPHIFTQEQISQRANVCNEWLGMISEDPNILERIITCDESWMHYYNPKTKIESEVWKSSSSPTVKKVQQQKSAGKVIITFFDAHGLIYQHVRKWVVKPEENPKISVDKRYYTSGLWTLLRHIHLKCPHFMSRWMLHHDIAKSHTAAFDQQFIEEHNIQVWPHPPYSPDLASCDFWLFPTLKRKLQDRAFHTDQAVITACQTMFRTIPEAEFRKAFFTKWPERMNKCIKSWVPTLKRKDCKK